MRPLIVLISLLLVLSGCRKYEDGFAIYKIRKGNHYSTRGVSFLEHDHLSFSAIFNESAVYQSVDPINQQDINKLYGFSECNDLHQDNSARFGWRYLGGVIEIHAYVYNDGVRISEYMGDVGIGSTHNYSIAIVNDHYDFTLDGHTISVPRTASCNTGFYYKLYPYFGGDESAPHDITIKIKENF